MPQAPSCRTPSRHAHSRAHDLGQSVIAVNPWWARRGVPQGFASAVFAGCAYVAPTLAPDGERHRLDLGAVRIIGAPRIVAV